MGPPSGREDPSGMVPVLGLPGWFPGGEKPGQMSKKAESTKQEPCSAAELCRPQVLKELEQVLYKYFYNLIPSSKTQNLCGSEILNHTQV